MYLFLSITPVNQHRECEALFLLAMGLSLRVNLFEFMIKNQYRLEINFGLIGLNVLLLCAAIYTEMTVARY